MNGKSDLNNLSGVDVVFSLSEFEAMVLDLKGTLEDILEYDDYMAEMHLTHLVQHGWVWLVVSMWVWLTI